MNEEEFFGSIIINDDEKDKARHYIGHTYDPEKAAEMFMEQKGAGEDYTKNGVEILANLENYYKYRFCAYLIVL